ncbi:hypothetical protein HYW11_02070, partial [Candidatus Peregrinibacteria bacterium]|nr:hypothetical protein [Candidatus Peregrinibacteria bacterium]
MPNAEAEEWEDGGGVWHSPSPGRLVHFLQHLRKAFAEDGRPLRLRNSCERERALDAEKPVAEVAICATIARARAL